MATELRKIFTRDFILLFFAQFAFTIANHVLIPTLPIYFSRLGSKETEIGILIGVFTVSSLILRPFVGRALSKFPEKKCMIVGALIFGLSSIVFPFVSSFWPFLLVRVFQGIGYAFFYTGSFTLIANISPDAHRGQSLSYFLLALNLSLALGPSLGMSLINYFSFTIFFLVCSSLSFCSFFFTSQMARRKAPSPEDSSLESSFFICREALPASIMNFFFFFIWGALTTFFPLYAIQQGVSNPGFFYTAIAVTIISSRILGGKILDRYGSEKLISPCLFILIFSMVILAFSKILPMFILAAFFWGVGHAFLYPSLVVYMLDHVSSSRGLAMSTMTALSDLGVCMGSVIMGILIPLTGYRIMFLCLAFISVINLSYFYFIVRKK